MNPAYTSQTCNQCGYQEPKSLGGGIDGTPEGIAMQRVLPDASYFYHAAVMKCQKDRDGTLHVTNWSLD